MLHRSSSSWPRATRAIQRGPLPGRPWARPTSTRPTPRSRARSTKFLGSDAERRTRAAQLEERIGAEGEGHEGGGEKARSARPRSTTSPPPKPPGERRPRCQQREAGEAEAKTVAARSLVGFPIFYPTRLPSGAYYVGSDSYEHVQDPRVSTSTAPTSDATAATRSSPSPPPRLRTALLRGPGDPGLVRPADPRQPDETRRSTGATTSSSWTATAAAAGRLEDRQRRLLGRQRPAERPRPPIRCSGSPSRCRK